MNERLYHGNIPLVNGDKLNNEKLNWVELNGDKLNKISPKERA